MSGYQYRDPYYNNNNTTNYGPPPGARGLGGPGAGATGQQQYYTDSVSDYNPYSESAGSRVAGGYGGPTAYGGQYRDEEEEEEDYHDAPQAPPKELGGNDGALGRNGTVGTRKLTRGNTGRRTTNEDVLRKDESRHSFTPLTQPPKRSTADLRVWRRDHHGNMWTKGGRTRCCGRFFCCTLLTFILFLVSILLTLIVFIRPPLVQFIGVEPRQNGSTFEATTNSEFKINLDFGIFVHNPNYFSASFQEIDVNIFYPINNTNVGGGSEKDISFPAGSDKNFTFPFSFTYSEAIDPGQKIILDLVNKCGFVPGSTKQDIKISYKLTFHIKVLVSIAPSFSGDASFECPVNLNDIKPFLDGLGINIPGLTSKV